MDYIRNVTFYIHTSVSKSGKIANTVTCNFWKDISMIFILMVINLKSYHFDLLLCAVLKLTHLFHSLEYHNFSSQMDVLALQIILQC